MSKDTPQWLVEDEGDNVPLAKVPTQMGYKPPAPTGYAPPTSYADGSETAPAQPKDMKTRLFHWGMKIITMGLCSLMAITAIIGLTMISGVEDAVGKFFVGFYMLFFATVLFTFELNSIRQVEAVDHLFRRNFGFLYSALGRALFLIFVAFLSFGLGEPATLSTATGCTLAVVGAVQLAVYLKYPEYFE
jgi:hypothetical protein